MSERWILYVFVFVVGFVGISLWNFYAVTHPRHIDVQYTPADFKLPSEDVEITAPDSVKLSGWLLKSTTTPSKAILILHGYPVEKGDMLNIALKLYPDFSLLLLDMRSFGDSGGAYTTLGVRERADISAALDFLEQRGYERIGIYGFSLGGALALISAAEDERVDVVASYASYANLRRLGWDIYKNIWILKYPLTELMIFWSKIFFGTAVTDASPLKTVPNISVPTLITHSRNDNQIPFYHAQLLQNALKNNRQAEFYFHEGFHGFLPADYYDKLNDFFGRSL